MITECSFYILCSEPETGFLLFLLVLLYVHGNFVTVVFAATIGEFAGADARTFCKLAGAEESSAFGYVSKRIFGIGFGNLLPKRIELASGGEARVLAAAVEQAYRTACREVCRQSPRHFNFTVAQTFGRNVKAGTRLACYSGLRGIIGRIFVG